MQVESNTTTASEESGGQLTITVAYAIDQVVITLTGELDLHTERDVIDTLSAAPRPGVVAMRIDATTIKFLDASGIRSLLAARQLAHDNELGFSLATTDNGPVVRLLDLCGLTKFFADNPTRACL
jgi:anti-anti-sigma factor